MVVLCYGPPVLTITGHEKEFPMNYGLSAQKGARQGYSATPLQVMLVDDQETSRRKIRNVLHGMSGFQVVAEATTCYEAFFLAEHTPFDLVITQLTLYKGNSVALTSQLKQLFPSPYVVILAPSLQDELLLKVFLAGADGYLTRDMSVHELCRAFTIFQGGGPIMLPAVSARIIRLLVERSNIMKARLAAAFQPTPCADDIVLAQPPQLEPVEAEDNIAPVSPLQRLSPQEEKVLRLLHQGHSNKQIAAHLSISPYTVGKHVQNILRKLGVANRTQAAAYLFLKG